ncbi:MAG: hypothetical protein PGN23_04255 [Sphingomonas adhaesiva]|uniref:hypothetical protein n=1 Tax=Sphingomonas adhaesiva TaxID=28212 RepID=UPI002FF53330
MEKEEERRYIDEITALLAVDTEYPLDGTLLHVTAWDDHVSPAIFKSTGNHIMYRDPDMNLLVKKLWDFWRSQTEDMRWCEIEYFAKDGNFTLSYTYPDEVDADETSLDRRDRIVKKYFGERPVIYPPWDENDDEIIYNV